MDFIERMRKEPSHVKTRFAFLVALACTLVIGTMWGISMAVQFKNPIDTTPVTEEKSSNETISDLVEFVKGNEASNVQNNDDQNEETHNDQPQENSIQSITELIRKGSTGTSSYDGTTKNPEPRVILIATTTSKKTE